MYQIQWRNVVHMKDFNKEGFTWSCIANMQKQAGERSSILYKIQKNYESWGLNKHTGHLFSHRVFSWQSPRDPVRQHCGAGPGGLHHSDSIQQLFTPAQLCALLNGITNLQPGSFHPSYKHSKRNLILYMLSREQLQLINSCVYAFFHTRWLGELFKRSQTGHFLASSLQTLDTTGSLATAPYRYEQWINNADRLSCSSGPGNGLLSW